MASLEFNDAKRIIKVQADVRSVAYKALNTLGIVYEPTPNIKVKEQGFTEVFVPMQYAKAKSYLTVAMRQLGKEVTVIAG